MKDRIRRVTEKRAVIFTLKLTAPEAANLHWLAEREFRRPGDTVRRLIHEAVAAARFTDPSDPPKETEP
jgi:hypothetical protein